MINAARIATLLWKEYLELRGSWAPWLPGILMLPIIGLPFLFTYVLPAFSGEPLDPTDFSAQLEQVESSWPEVAVLPPRAAVQAFLFQQFLFLVVLVPVTGAMSIAAHSIIGEKQGRSLEPLLVTPLTATELLLAKVLAALLPAFALECVALVLYFGAIALTADSGVTGAVLSIRSAVVSFLVGPLTALVGLQLVVLASTRARDPRSAQQVGVLVVLPLVAVVVGQSAAVIWLSVRALLLATLVLLATWLALLRIAIALFDNEHVITRWR